MLVKDSIIEKLSEAFTPSFLNVVNESHMHAVPTNSETHFKVTIVSSSFDGKRSVARHQLIYGLLANELSNTVHALALHTYTEEEWQARGSTAPNSPECAGGSNNQH